MTFAQRMATMIALILLFQFTAIAQVSISLDRPDGIFSVGETVHWTITLDKNAKLDSLTYSLKLGGLTVVSEGALPTKGNKARLQHQFTAPGAILLELDWVTANGSHNEQLSGAIADPDKIALSSERPADFDAFWDKQIELLKAIPKNTQIQHRHLPENPNIEYAHIQMKNINKSWIRGQMAKPKDNKKLPALLIVQWAGVYPLQPEWAIDKAKEGWLVLNINPHDLPIDREQHFYTEKKEGFLKDYPSIDNESREQSYFLRMYLSCFRAAEYLTEHPDWDGETLVVMGTSQGGLQAVVTAGLHPKITASMALVPAGFDTMGPTIGRKGGWPHWYTNTEGKDKEKVWATSRYYDVANFVPNIKCPVLVGIGLLDQTCPPEGIYAGINQLKGYREVLLLPRSEHQSKEGSQDAYTQKLETVWLPALREGTFSAKD